MGTAESIGPPQGHARLLPRVPIVAVLVALVSLGACLGVRALAIGPLDVASDTPALGFPLIVIGSVMPVFGNAVGFFLSYRRPTKWSLIGFLAPGAAFLIGGSVPVALHWLDGRDGGALAAGLVVTAFPVALIVPALLLFGRTRAHSAPSSWRSAPAAAWPAVGLAPPPATSPPVPPPTSTVRIDVADLATAVGRSADTPSASTPGPGTIRLTPEQLLEARRRAREKR